MMKKFYITTPIYYPSANAHLGHCYSTVASDVMARYKRLKGFEVLFSTGTDEHGQKIENCSKKAGVTPKEYVDKISENFKNLWELLDISYDKFIRTTDEFHVKSVQKIFNSLYEKGKIYKGYYNGWYCVPCETFYTEKQIMNGKCPECGRTVELHNEDAYFFKLSEYKDKILDLLKNNHEFLEPESRRNEMIKFVEEGLQDLCVSRSSFKWGIPVEFDSSHVVYVWLDALTNYITLLGYPDGEEFSKFWPADVHIVGKEIVRFHAVIWPAILMALDLPLPKKIYGHGWILFGDGEKMSKSRGNVVDPFVLQHRYGKDALRYFLMREIPFGNDGLFSNEIFIKRINSDLANDLGNLLSRVTALIEKYFNSNLIYDKISSKEDNELINFALSIPDKCERLIEKLNFSSYLSEIWQLVSKCNKYVDICAPWNLAKSELNRDRLSTVLYNVLECLRIISILISPVMPKTAKEIQEQIGANEETCSWEKTKIFAISGKKVKINRSDAIFPRLDYEEEIKKLMSLNLELEKKSQKNEDDSKISIEDFTKIKLIVAKVIACENVKKSKKLLKLTLNDGTSDRTVVSGISQYYLPDELLGRNVVLVSNLAPAKLCGVESNGMVLAAENEGNVKVIFMDNCTPGSIIR